MEEVEERVSKLEAVLGRFIVQTDMMLKRMEQDTATFKEEVRHSQQERDEDLKKFRKEVRTDQQARDKDTEKFRQEVRADQQARDKDMQQFREEVRRDQQVRDKDTKKFREDTEKFRQEVRADQQARDKNMQQFREEVQADRQARGEDTKKFREDTDRFRQEVRADQQARDKDMQQFREEMQADRQARDKNMQQFREEVRADQQTRDKDMQQFREEMQAGRHNLEQNLERVQREIQEDLQEYKVMSNKRWGELANRLGTVVEDIVAPNLPTIAQQYFGCTDIDFFGLRIKRKNQVAGKSALEFDAILVCSDYLIVNETKTKPDANDVKSFREGQLKRIFDYFPEYQGKTVVPIFSSLSFTEATLKYLTKNKIYAMSSKGDTMDLLNFEAIQKKK